MCTVVFLKEVLNGTKQLLKLSEITAIPKVPRLSEIDVKQFWSELKLDPVFSSYFPSVFMRENRVPDRSFFFTVC